MSGVATGRPQGSRGDKPPRLHNGILIGIEGRNGLGSLVRIETDVSAWRKFVFLVVGMAWGAW
jgi:hypothetical protein